MLSREWFSLTELAAMELPNMPASPAGMADRAKRCRWLRSEWENLLWRQRRGRGGGCEFHILVLGALGGKAAEKRAAKASASEATKAAMAFILSLRDAKDLSALHLVAASFGFRLAPSTEPSNAP